ncbi:TonB-dependent receptor [Novosphingobium sp. PS1R-30]|uniref:TonB-dependent receptor n=1 Tax=Novosphingobium anseongense TaxID=3133436 RepID=A0ABU8RQ76_9SPHN
MRHSKIIYLLASTAFLAQPAFADEVAADAATEAESGDIVVFGQGETRQVQQVDAKQIQILTPGSSPIRAIEKLPSVNIQASDPFGTYEWSTRVTIRSFTQDKLGFNLDGIPLGDMQYGNHNGLHVSRAISSENIGSTRVAQGAGAIDTQATNNLGGTVEYFSMDPLDHFAVDSSLTYGTTETFRAFARVNVGSTDGFRGYVSYGFATTDKYKGDGRQKQHIVNAKAVMPVGDGQIDGWFSYSDRREQDYQDMSLDMLARLGYDFDNVSDNYALAVQLADIANNIDANKDGKSDITGFAPSNPAAGTRFPGQITSLDDAYYDAAGLRKDTLASLGYKTPIGEDANVAIKGYYHRNTGMGLWGTPYTQSPTGAPISVRTTEYDIQRYGVFASADFKLGFNAIKLGGWYEHNDFNQARRFYALASRTDPGFSFQDYPKNPFATQWDFDFTTKTVQYFVQDTIELDRLKIDLGWKGYKVTNEAVAIVKGVFPEGRFKTEDWFQPSVGAVFNLDDHAEVFASFAQATRAFPSVNGSIWGTTQAGFDAIKDTIKPETSNTFELGFRYNTSRFKGVLGAYYVDFKNRLLGVSSGPGIQGNPSVLQNVGSVRSIGIEAAGDLKLTDTLGIYASYTYTDATYRDDVFDRAGVLVAAIQGSTVVDTPKHMAHGEVNYDDGGLFARVAVNYMSKRYFTYTNDLRAPGDGLGFVPGRAIVDATLGYRLNENIEVQINASNLLDKRYVGTIGSNGYGNIGDNQTLLVAAPQQVFGTVKVTF